MSDDDRKALGIRLKEAREYLGLSQEEVAKALKVPRSAVSHVETGQRRVDALELKQLAELYQRPVSELTGEVEFDAELRPPPAIAHLARAAQKLSDSDRAELLRFAEFLAKKPTRSRRNPKG
jgi:transcriptional regulator with XRE-family HTH domain